MPVKFCQECGSPMVEGHLGGRLRPNCERCGFIHYGLHSIGVGGLVIKEDRVLLIQRAQNPGKGRWTIPGGFVENDEVMDLAVVREVFEETGIETEIERLYAVRHRVTPTDSNVYFVFKLRAIGGELTSSFDPEPEEIAHAGFYSLEEMDKLDNLADFTRHLVLIDRAGAGGLTPYDIPSMAGPGWTFYASNGRPLR
ncbi:MAG TPA: NUDIX hydrolase [Dehalococcoidia bacterium]|nr:NUDIX hydrolase [Dehalococcoidia bacterium]